MKKILVIALAIIICLSCIACSYNYKMQSFTVEDETIILELKSESGYSFESNIPVDFTYNEKVVATGSFYLIEYKEKYREQFQASYNEVENDSQYECYVYETTDSNSNVKSGAIIDFGNDKVYFMITSENDASTILEIVNNIVFK